MNKLFLTMPKLVLEKYLNSHYRELTEEEGLYLLKKGFNFPNNFYQNNRNLGGSSQILEFVLDNDVSKIEYFESLAFNEIIIAKIASLDYIPSLLLVRRVPKLLNNEKLKLKIIEKSPSMDIISLLNKNQFDENVLSILERNEQFIPEIENIINYPILEKSSLLIKRAIKDDPEVLLYLSKIDNNLIDSEVLNGLNIDLNILRERTELRENTQLMYLALSKDPNAIVLFNRNIINNNLINFAISRGYIPKDEDFQENPFLGESELIMELAITVNPRLIRYIKTRRLSSPLIQKALEEYEVTEEDLKYNPYLGRIPLIINNLIQKNPNLEIYRADLDNSKKEEIIKSFLQGGKIDELINLPFLNTAPYGKISPQNVKKLIMALSIKTSDDNMDLQEEYYQVLNSIIDGIINMRYQENKHLLLFPSVDAIDEKVKIFFKQARINNDVKMIDELIATLYNFVNGYYSSIEHITEDYLRKRIYELYQQYLSKNNLSREETSDFYNEILNKHEDKYKNDKKNEIVNSLIKQMSLTTKKIETIITGRKLQKIDTLMVSGQYEELGITKEELLNRAYNLRNHLNSMREFRKKNIRITDDNFKILEEAFIKGILTPDYASTILRISDSKILKLIVDEYNQIKRQFLNKIALLPKEYQIILSEKEKFGFNYNNFLIGDSNRYFENLTKLIGILYDEQVSDILENTPYFDEILAIIPFAGLLKEFQVNDLISILSHYPRAKERILELEGKTNQNEKEALNTVLLRFDSLIKIANGYASSDDIQTVILGNRVIKKVHASSSKRYFDFYIKMIDRIKGQIPPVSLVVNNWKVESGDYHDQERLLIGRNCSPSCVDLDDESGHKTYQKCLLENDGDVIIIRNKQTNSFLARILIFRKGNIVMMAPITEGSKESAELGSELYNRVLLDKIGQQIIDQARNNNDNIDFVFLTRQIEELDFLKYKVVASDGFMSEFPHADLEPSAYLIANSAQYKTKKITSADIRYDEVPKAFYLKPRKEVKWNENTDENELSRIRALKVIKEKDSELKDEYARNFEQFSKDSYSYIINGEDWYIAIKKDGVLEELLVPSQDERSIIEFEQAKEKLWKMNLIAPSEKISK